MAEKLYLPINLRVDGRKKAQKKPLTLRSPVLPPVEPLDLAERLRRLREQEYIEETERLPFAPRPLPLRAEAERLLAAREGQVLRPPVTFRGKTPGEMLFPQELRIPSLGGRGLPGMEPEPAGIPQLLPPETFGPPSETRAVPRMALGVAKGLVSPFIPPAIGRRIGMPPIEWETQPTPMGALAAIPGGALIGPEMAAIGAGMRGLAREAPQVGRAARARVAEMPALARRAMMEQRGGYNVKPTLWYPGGKIAAQRDYLELGRAKGVPGISPERLADIRRQEMFLEAYLAQPEPAPYLPISRKATIRTERPLPPPQAIVAKKTIREKGVGFGKEAFNPENLDDVNKQIKNLQGAIRIGQTTKADITALNENLLMVQDLRRSLLESKLSPQQWTHYQELEQKAFQLEQQIAEGKQAGGVTYIRRPPKNAKHGLGTWSNAKLEALARQEGVNPYLADWWDAIDSVAVRDFRGMPTSYFGKKVTSPVAYASELRDVNQEIKSLEAIAKGIAKPPPAPVAEAAVRPPSAVPEGAPVRLVPRGEMPSAPPPGPKAEIPSVQPPMPAPVAAKPVGGAPPGGIPPVKPPTAVGGAPPKEPLDPQAVVKEWTAQIREAKKLRGPTAEAISKERAKRKAIIEKALVGKRGGEARRAAFGAAKGEILTPEFEPASQVFTPEKAELLQEMIRDRFQKDAYRYLPAQTAFDKLFTGGRIPSPSELSVLEEVFGSDLIKTILGKRASGQKIWELFLESWNVPKSLKASFDISATLRQGAYLLFEGNPAKEAFITQLKSLRSEANFKAINEGIMSNKWYDFSQGLGKNSLDLTLPRVATGLIGKEEPYIGAGLASRIPIIGKGVRLSERAYTSFLNKIRMDTFAKQAEILQKQNAPREAYGKLAWNINIMSGRGSLGRFSQAAMLLNLPFFSPRFAVSRFQLPLTFATKNPALLKMVLRDMVGYISSVFAVGAILDMTGVADVEWDIRSSDFGKIRVGNRRIDPFAGFQQPAVFVAQLLAGKRKTTTTGALQPIDPRDRAAQFAETKLSTTPGALLALRRGRLYGGEKLTPQSFLVSLLAPMPIQDIWESAESGKGLSDSILWGFGAGALAEMGVGVQVFGTNVPNWQKDLVEYNAIPASAMEREAKGIRFSREKYRERNPEIDAKLFILGEVSSLQSGKAITAALKLIKENNIKPEDIRGIKAKMDEAKERQKFGLAPKPDDTLVGYLMRELNKLTPTQTPLAPQNLRDLLPITPTPQNLRELLPAGVR